MTAAMPAPTPPPSAAISLHARRAAQIEALLAEQGPLPPHEVAAALSVSTGLVRFAVKASRQICTLRGLGSACGPGAVLYLPGQEPEAEARLEAQIQTFKDTLRTAQGRGRAAEVRARNAAHLRAQGDVNRDHLRALLLGWLSDGPLQPGEVKRRGRAEACPRVWDGAIRDAEQKGQIHREPAPRGVGTVPLLILGPHPDPQGLTPRQRAVLSVLTHTPTTTSDLTQKLGISRELAWSRANELAERGLVVRTHLTPHPRGPVLWSLPNPQETSRDHQPTTPESRRSPIVDQPRDQEPAQQPGPDSPRDRGAASDSQSPPGDSADRQQRLDPLPPRPAPPDPDPPRGQRSPRGAALDRDRSARPVDRVTLSRRLAFLEGWVDHLEEQGKERPDVTALLRATREQLRGAT